MSAAATAPSTTTIALQRRDREHARPISWIGLAIVAAFVLLAVVGPLIAPADPLAQDLVQRLQRPSTAHLLGTDALGRDVASRVIYATRVDLPLGLAAASISAAVGIVLGAAGGFIGHWVDLVLMRLGDLVMAFPTYVLVIALITIMGAGIPAILVSFALLGWVPYARVLRSEIRRVAQEEYIAAANLAGIPSLRVLAVHVLPNAIRPIISYYVLDIMMAILTLASLSYLGLGVQPPTPEWGSMVAEGQPYLQTHWWLTAAPGLTIAALGLGFILIGESIERRLRA
ncbi:ABC transporter permease [Microbacterium protaetiae]|uniref:ABC transporter permease n=1 Tax=Microbacterium protaetiae TaxID=2509458 RepID=A0A4P6ECW4_9MICO|nr:ABC transporter permease [Microbacterium protaetiae]QAY59924.1 ABC transporter permease [Microbacterium protaetiae]